MLIPVIAVISTEIPVTIMESPEMDSATLQVTVSALATSSRQDLAEMKTRLPSKVIVQPTTAKKGHRPVMWNQREVVIQTKASRRMAMHAVLLQLRHAVAVGRKCLRCLAAKPPFCFIVEQGLHAEIANLLGLNSDCAAGGC